MEKLGRSNLLQVKDGYLYTMDGNFLVMFVEPTYPPSESNKNSTLVHNIESQVDSLNEEHQIGKTMLFGGPVIAVANADRIRADIKIVATMSIAFILILLIIVFRNPITPLLFVFPPALGFIMGLGAYSLIAEHISALALGVSTIMLGIAIDYSFHFFNHYRHNGSVKQTIKEIISPLLLGCTTTVLAFFGLNSLNSGILREFGLLAGLILIFSAISVLVFLPALIRVTGFKMKEVKPLFTGVQLPLFLNKLALPIFTVLTIGLFFFADEAQFEDDLNKLNYFPEHLQEAQEIISGPSTEEQVYVLLKGNEASAVSRGHKLAKALDVLRLTGTQINFSSGANVLLNEAEVDARIKNWEKVEQAESLITEIESIGATIGLKTGVFNQYRSALSSNFDSIYMDAFNSPVLEDHVLRTDSSFALIVSVSVKRTDRHKLEEVIISVGEKPVATSSLAKALIDSVNEDLNFILILTSGLVLITLLLTYGRIELALLTFIPMILSWVWILGICGIFGIKFNMVNVVVTTFIFGLGDDYSIFITDGILSKHKTGLNKLKSYRGAILLSALTTIVGTGVLGFAGHPALKSIAILSVVGMISVVTAALIVQPFLFKLLIENRTAKGKPPLTWLDLFVTFRDFGWFFIGCIGLIISLPFFYFFPAKSASKRQLYNKMLSPLMQSVISMNTHVSQKWEDEELAQLEKPAIIIANHTSFIDILACSGYDSRILILTNEWVWNSPFFGWPIRYAEYIRAKNNGDLNMEMIRRKISEGYSILVFPEGTRSYDGKVGRFKKGAFKLAEELDLDILPLVLHGFHRVLNKGDYVVNRSHLNGRFLPRIKPDDKSFGDTYSQKAKLIGRHFKSEFEKDVIRLETPQFHNQWVRRCYTYKGPVLEWYVRIKLMLESNYEDFIKHIPRDAKVYDLGCGYGYLSFMLAFTSEQRKVIGVDYDKEKVSVAANSFHQGRNVQFQHVDLTTYNPEEADAYIIKDVLHYMTPSNQDALLERCASKLNTGGTIIIRDGIEEDKKGQKITAWTEIFSTKLIGFNKTKNDLHFLSETKINAFANRHRMSVEVIRNEHSSNHTFILKHAG
jgi:1-acyl-sn-glycerol-3-phosphate acyltransferase